MKSSLLLRAVHLFRVVYHLLLFERIHKVFGMSDVSENGNQLI